MQSSGRPGARRRAPSLVASRRRAVIAITATVVTIVAMTTGAPNRANAQDTRASTAATRAPTSTATPQAALQAARVRTAAGKSFTLQIADGWRIRPAAEGMARIRFGAFSPDGRFFVPDMIDLSDNSKGRVWVLSGFDETTGRFTQQERYLTGLRNPNDVTFWTDPATRETWIYIALTHAIVRYRYFPGDNAPRTPPQTIARFPDRGLSFKHGGWHLTRTVVITSGVDPTLYVSVGSSCNVCEEKLTEPSRAAILSMAPDGTQARVVATGLRNAVGLELVNGRLIVTNMGSDHLGRDKPDETMYDITQGAHYGWPYCYQSEGRVVSDPKLGATTRRIDCRTVPKAIAIFPAHSAPLGLHHFTPAESPRLAGSALVALHGSGDRSYRRGYSVVQVRGGVVSDFLTGFLSARNAVNGRPVDIVPYGRDRFLLTDDVAGIVYLVDRPA